MVVNKKILNRYPDQNYSVFYNQQNGMLIRIEDTGYPEPHWCKNGPELIDISITNMCNKNCHYCYRNSSKTVKHMDLFDYEQILKQASSLKVLQVALGGGEPTLHPHFQKILKITSEKYGMVSTYTSNGDNLSNEILKATKKHCGAIALSIHDPTIKMNEKINMILDWDIKLNLHFLLNAHSFDKAIFLIETIQDFAPDVNAVIFLNYKNIGRNKSNQLLAKNNPKIKQFFKTINESNVKIGFDSCSISGITKYLEVNPNSIESCEAARFSMFISENLYMFPCSFMIDDHLGEKLTGNNMQQIWRNSTLFTNFRNKNISDQCFSCSQKVTCKGGCPILPEINLCN